LTGGSITSTTLGSFTVILTRDCQSHSFGTFDGALSKWFR
jgi:hypothetical protein